MRLTYLGHAGFIVESETQIILMDPWLSPNGAFCKSWYQYPNNHFLFSSINDFFSNSKKNRSIYISHEHKDHFDLDFLGSLLTKDFNFIIPDYRSDILKREISQIKCREIIECTENDRLELNDLSVQLFIDDTGINRDSAIIVSDDKKTFLNMNDCKIYERSSEIKKIHSKIDIAAIQFSGATWYPICYDFNAEAKKEAMIRKRDNKFNLVLQFLNKIKPNYYIPSAGPPCFLADELKDINFINPTQFPQKEEFFQFFNKSENKTNILMMGPGDVYEAANRKLIVNDLDPIKSKNISEYIAEYSKIYSDEFNKEKIDAKDLLNHIVIENLKKLKIFKNIQLSEPFCLYMAISGYLDKLIKIDFNDKKIKLIDTIDFDLEDNYYKVSAPAWLYKKVIDKEISWSDFALTFRVNIRRNPDIYSSFIQGFLLSEVEDCKYLLEMLQDLGSQEERIVVSNLKDSYEIDRYCPHMGADLKDASIVDCQIVCPRHGWKFDLKNDGKCENSHNATINSKRLKN